MNKTFGYSKSSAHTTINFPPDKQRFKQEDTLNGLVHCVKIEYKGYWWSQSSTAIAPAQKDLVTGVIDVLDNTSHYPIMRKRPRNMDQLVIEFLAMFLRREAIDFAREVRRLQRYWEPRKKLRMKSLWTRRWLQMFLILLQTIARRRENRRQKRKEA